MNAPTSHKAGIWSFEDLSARPPLGGHEPQSHGPRFGHLTPNRSHLSRSSDGQMQHHPRDRPESRIDYLINYIYSNRH